MRKLLPFALSLLSLTAAALPTNTMRFNFTDFVTDAQSVRMLQLYPLDASFTNGAGVIVTRDRISRPTGTSGTVTISNLYGGNYRAEFQGTTTISTNWFTFPNSNGTMNASDWMVPRTNGWPGLLAYSQAQADARFALSRDYQFASQTNSGQWFWAASVSDGVNDRTPREEMSWVVGTDGITWTQAVKRAYTEPNFNSNYLRDAASPGVGPWSRDGALQICGREYWYAYNYDPFATNVASQGIGLARSSDGTNWSRHAVLYPYGETNSGTRMFAPTWFTDNDGSNYLIGVYGTTVSPAAFNVFQIRRLDSTWTNWSAPVTITPAGGGGVAFKWDAYIQREGANYAMYYAGAATIAKATRANLNGTFGTGVDLGWGTGEAPSVVKITSSHWRGYWRDQTGYMLSTDSYNSGSTWSNLQALVQVVPVTSRHFRRYSVNWDGEDFHPWYQDSYDAGATWGATNSGLTGPQEFWHGAGIAFITTSNASLASIDQEYQIGTNYGSVRIGAPLLKAGAGLFENLDINNGAITRDLFARGGVTAGRFGISAGEAVIDIDGGSGAPSYAAQNGSIYLRSDTGQLYQRASGAWSLFTGGGGSTPWLTNSGTLYDVLSTVSGGNQQVAIGTNATLSKFAVVTFSQGIDTPDQIAIENGYIDPFDPDPGIARAAGITLKNAHPSAQPWKVMTLYDDLRLTRYTASQDFFTIDNSGNVGVTNKLRVNGAERVTGNITNDVLTPSRLVMSDASSTPALKSAAASGAVPINADGSAATFAQVNALAPGAVLTNGNSFAATFSNQFKIDIQHQLVASNATASRVAMFDAANQLTNVFAGAAPIDGDGTRTTFAQINTLGPGDIVTNKHTLALELDNTLLATNSLTVGTQAVSFASNQFTVATSGNLQTMHVGTDGKTWVEGAWTGKGVGTNLGTLWLNTAGVIDSDTGALQLKSGGNGVAVLVSGSNPILRAFADNTDDIGNANFRWRDLHISRQITNSSAANQSGISLGTTSMGQYVNGARGLISGNETTLTESTATAILTCVLANSKYATFRIFATTHADDSTDFQSNGDELIVAAINKGGTVTLTVSAVSPSASATSAGTLATTWTATAASTTISIKNSAVSSLTQTTLKCKWRVDVDTDDTALSISPQ